MAMTTCKECGGELSTKAEACPKCGAKPRRTSLAAWGCLAVLGFMMLGVVGTLLNGGSSSPGALTAVPGSDPSAGSGSPAPDNLTVGQRNAFRSANSYLKMSGFSRQGLIDQLSSEYGEKFSVEDATVAVDKLTVDWNEQAARSAASYLKMSAFSCQGLIDQLSSANGEKYTVEQARAGATRAGIC